MNRRYVLIAATRAAAPGVVVGARRLAEVDPHVPRTIVVLDGDTSSIAAVTGLGEVRTGEDLGISADELGLWAAAYGPRGLIWAAFPHVLAAVGSVGEHLLWIGADVEVVDTPTAFWDALGGADLVAGGAAPRLSPHEHDTPDAANGQPRALQPVTAVVEHDGELVSRSILGWNAGSTAAARALASWPVPREHPTHESIANACVAQVWFNALALHGGAHLVEDRGTVLSVAQLLDREVTEGPSINGAPLRLLGLRGFDAERPHLLEGRVVTARVSERPALAPILTRRAAALLDAGWTYREPWMEPITSWDAFPGGLQNTPLVRDVARAGIRAGAVTKSPFEDEGWQQLAAWLRGPARVGGSIGVNRLLAAVHASRPDLHAAYPSLDGPDGLGFLGWAWVYGREELQIPEPLLPPKPAFLDAAPSTTNHRRSQPDKPGVNLAGYFTSELGLGESARQIANALGAAGVSTTPVQGLLVPPTRQQAEFQPVGPQDAQHDVNIVVVNGDQMPAFARDVGDGFFEARPTIAVWWWEVDPFPIDEWREALRWVDEIWVGTEFIRTLVEPHVDVPVWVFPVPVSVSRLEEPLTREHFGFAEDETIFLYVWDYHSTEARKNPSGLVEAYRRAFPDGAPENTRLILKCINHENLPEADEKVRLAAAGRPDITFIDRFLSGREKNALLELADCYVSPHRSEGFGYTPAEAMLLGKPVIVTAYGGTTEYTDANVARLVQWTPARVGRGAPPYPPDGMWSEPDLDDLADAMRWIVEEPEAAREMAARGCERVTTNHSLERSGAKMSERIDIMRARYRSAGELGRHSTNGTGSSASGSQGGVRGMRAHASMIGGLRRRWWTMQDRSVAARTADIRLAVAKVDGEAAARSDEMSRVLRAVTSETERLRQRVELLAAEVETSGRDAAKLVAQARKTEESLTARVDAVNRTVQEHLNRHSVEPWGMKEAGYDLEEVPELGRAFGASRTNLTGETYADFLATFRGPYERVVELVLPYAPLLRGQAPLLDIGCGRGELLEVAASVGTEGQGVDLDEELVRQAESRGHSAVVGDGIAVLRSQPSASLGAVTAVHVIEHLSVSQLTDLFAEALRALRPGGVLIAETINPHEVSAATTFWVDPTHRGPVFPEVALSLALSTGFERAHVFAPDGTNDWSADRTRSTRYALVARA